MKHSDIEAVEKALFQYYDDKFDDGFLYLTEDDISDIEQIFGGNDNWREPVSMERDFSIEEILDMPTEGEVQMNLSLLILIAWNRMNYAKWCPLRLVCSSKEPDYIETDNESHSGEIPRELFCVPGNDSDYIDIDDLY